MPRADISFQAKHPIILSCQHRVVEMYLKGDHLTYNHEGVENIRGMIQKEHWIIGLRNSMRAVRHSCVTCRKRCHGTETYMSQLPVNRLILNVRPITNTGVKYFGSETVSERCEVMGLPVYLFECRVVRLELVDGLVTQAGLDAVYRFVARGGQPKSILSGNGTNFVGAANEFKAAFSDLKRNALTKHLAEKRIKFSFNPPAAPHFRGVWYGLSDRAKKPCTTSYDLD
ncbi:uncharacterized protein LOC142349180 [Convolutriloba macropyga]|uniref:uncharacterized protein LOC142349180 n=1 Tax=Convolutriloba macropyga TaxID=536237 RepID=UPI003F51D6B7